MEVITCPLTASAIGSEHVQLASSRALRELPSDGEETTGSFDTLLEGVLMSKGFASQDEGGAGAGITVKGERVSEADLDEAEAELEPAPKEKDSNVLRYSVITPLIYSSQNLTFALNDVAGGDGSEMLDAGEYGFSEARGLSVEHGLKMALDTTVSGRLGSKQKMNGVSLAGFGDEVSQEVYPDVQQDVHPFQDVLLGSADPMNVTQQSFTEHKPQGFAVKSLEQVGAEVVTEAITGEQKGSENETFGTVSAVFDTHKGPELSFLIPEKGMELDMELEELVADAVSDMRDVSVSEVEREKVTYGSGESWSENAARDTKNLSETVELDVEVKVDEESTPAFLFGGIGQTNETHETNEQVSVASPNAQNQVGEVNDRSIPEQIIESVQYIEKDDIKEFDIELTPKELGRVRVNITTDGESVNVHLVAENPQVAEVIRAELPVLRDVLARQGLVFGQVDVGVRDDGNTQGNDKHPHPSRQAHSVKGVEHQPVHGLAYQARRAHMYGSQTSSQVDYVA